MGKKMCLYMWKKFVMTVRDRTIRTVQQIIHGFLLFSEKNRIQIQLKNPRREWKEQITSMVGPRSLLYENCFEEFLSLSVAGRGLSSRESKV